MNAATCANCGRKIPAGTPHVFSRWTKAVYCADLTSCLARKRRLRAHMGARPKTGAGVDNQVVSGSAAPER